MRNGNLPDEHDRDLLTQRSDRRNQRPGMRVGDWLVLLDGTIRRIAYIWTEAKLVQPTDHEDTGSFYLGLGYLSMSGGLDSGLPMDDFTSTGMHRKGSCWLFHHNIREAHNGVDMELLCRLFQQVR